MVEIDDGFPADPVVPLPNGGLALVDPEKRIHLAETRESKPKLTDMRALHGANSKRLLAVEPRRGGGEDLVDVAAGDRVALPKGLHPEIAVRTGIVWAFAEASAQHGDCHLKIGAAPWKKEPACGQPMASLHTEHVIILGKSALHYRYLDARGAEVDEASVRSIHTKMRVAEVSQPGSTMFHENARFVAHDTFIAIDEAHSVVLATRTTDRDRDGQSRWTGRLLQRGESSEACKFLHPTEPFFACRRLGESWTALSVSANGELVREGTLGSSPTSILAFENGEVTITDCPSVPFGQPAGGTCSRATNGKWSTIDRPPADGGVLFDRNDGAARTLDAGWFFARTAVRLDDERVRVWPYIEEHRVCARLSGTSHGGRVADCRDGTLVYFAGRFGLLTSGGVLYETIDSARTWQKVDLRPGMPAPTMGTMCNALGCLFGPYLRLGWGR